VGAGRHLQHRVALAHAETHDGQPLALRWDPIDFCSLDECHFFVRESGRDTVFRFVSEDTGRDEMLQLIAIGEEMVAEDRILALPDVRQKLNHFSVDD